MPCSHRLLRSEAGTACRHTSEAVRIGPAELAAALDQRDIESLFLAERTQRVTVSQLVALSANTAQGYAALGVKRVVIDLPTEPRDDTLRRLDRMAAEFATLI